MADERLTREEVVVNPQQTQNICITYHVQCWANVEDVGPTLYKCYTKVLCSLGYCFDEMDDVHTCMMT